MMNHSTGDDMQTETIQEYLARGGLITQLPETRIPTWSEANDELVKLAWHTYVPPKPETEEDDDQC
jgi:hypothetical protein